jgi:hypothetical protein
VRLQLAEEIVLVSILEWSTSVTHPTAEFENWHFMVSINACIMNCTDLISDGIMIASGVMMGWLDIVRHSTTILNESVRLLTKFDEKDEALLNQRIRLLVERELDKRLIDQQDSIRSLTQKEIWFKQQFSTSLETIASAILSQKEKEKERSTRD